MKKLNLKPLLKSKSLFYKKTKSYRTYVDKKLSEHLNGIKCQSLCYKQLENYHDFSDVQLVNKLMELTFYYERAYNLKCNELNTKSVQINKMINNR